MNTPTWVLEIVGAVMLLVAEVSAGQLAVTLAWTRRGGTDAGIAVSQLLMGIAMADILVPGLRVVPHAVWDVVFAVATAWFAWCLWRESGGRGGAAMAGGRYAPHLVHSAALLYLFAALPGPSVTDSGMSAASMSGMAGMGGSSGMPGLHASALALIFTLLLLACTVRDLDRRARADGYFQVAGRRLVPAGPALAAAGPVTVSQTADVDAERLLLSPAVVKGCQVATGLTIAFILIIMI